VTAARPTFVVATGPDEPAEPYVAALLAAGAAPEEVLIVDSGHDDADEASRRVAGAAGLLLCGGVDVEPARYGEPAREDVELSVDARRDRLDFALLEAARAHAVPTLAVCRGLQALNAFLGGSLHQHLPLQIGSEVPHAVAPQEALAHAAFVEDVDHPMAHALRQAPLVVNSSHHQGIQRLAPAMVAIARSADDLVEAAALPAGESWWAQGVQWHPENLLELPLQRGLFASFLEAGRRRVRMHGAPVQQPAAPSTDGARA
jgi:putative glutamine amidotransferase